MTKRSVKQVECLTTIRRLVFMSILNQGVLHADKVGMKFLAGVYWGVNLA
ncbi:hypothetical protein [Pseudidiomarina sp.]